MVARVGGIPLSSSANTEGFAAGGRPFSSMQPYITTTRPLQPTRLMTSPPRTITVTCPKCATRYEDWIRPSINLSMDDFGDDYVREATSVTCPACDLNVKLETLIVDADGRFCVSE